MRRAGLLVALVLAAGIAGTAVALRSREDNSQFVAQQQRLLPVRAAAVERLTLTTSDPRPGYGGRALHARCVSAGATVLGNPWTCVVRYPRLPRVRYGLSIYADRSIYGSGRPEGSSAGTALTVSGCCVGAP
jgi:hypothetical protein